MKRTHNHQIAVNTARLLNIPVFPVREKDYSYTVEKSGKTRVLNAKSPYTRTGFKAATKDQKEIDAFWFNYPNAAVGVPTGLHSGLLVIDIDDGNGKNGEATWATHKFELPPTVQTRTMSGGRHLIFKVPLDLPIRSSAGKVFGPNIDVRCGGGYVIWAGTKMEKGNYSFIEGHSPDEVSFAEVPPHILNFFIKQKKETQKEENIFVTEGRRNETLFDVSVRHVHAGSPEDAVKWNAVKLNSTFQPPLEKDEVERTVKSAFNYRRNDIFPLTDLGNAERFRRDAIGKILYVKEEKGWRNYNGICWRQDHGIADRQAHETIRKIIQEAGTDPDSIQVYSKWQKTSEAGARIKAMVDVASNLEGLSVGKNTFDQKKRLLNLLNGTLNLKTGDLQPHSAQDMITKVAGCSFDPNAKAPRFEQFIKEIMDGDKADINYIQKLIGYCLSGERPEQLIQFFMGEGGDGKSVLLETIRNLLGDYQITLSASTFSAKNAGAIPNDVARLAGARFAGVSELPKGLYVNTQLMKGISGGDTLSARFLHQEFFDFKPEALLLFITNFYPFIDVEDKAFLRRVRILKFPRNFSENSPDLYLQEKINKELSGILNWAIEGYRLYKKDGLYPSPNMFEALENYKKFIDPLDGFFEERIEITNNRKDFITLDDLHSAAKTYAFDEDRGKIELQQLNKYMTMKGYQRKLKRTENGRIRGFVGLRIVDCKDIDVPF